MTEPSPPAFSTATPPSAGAKRRVFIKTYGCQMNVYDSERMADLLAPHGYEACDAPEAADLVVLNTCHIREKASEKLYSDLGRLRDLKDERPAQPMTIAVAGCVAQAEGSEIARRAPVVDIVVGPQAYHRLPELIARAARERGEALDTEFAAEEKFDRLGERRPDGVSAYLTVQEGCDKFCTFCVVPYTRGAEVSRRADDILAEARSLVSKGVREITLLGQNVNGWRGSPAADAGGVAADADGAWGLGALCRRLAQIDGVQRLRFTTSHPRDMNDDLIAALGELDALMPYLHLPVQAGSDRILAAMNRGHAAEDYLDLIARIRAARSDIAISGDFIVGFPGETDADFDATIALADRVQYAAAYAFKFSRRPGTPASAMPKQIDEATKDQRLERLNAALRRQRDDFCAALVGRRLPVLLEKPGRSEGQLIGRSPYLQSVYLDAPLFMIGSTVAVEILAVNPNALKGRLADRPLARA
jgi:tRNA-2-methylthio-N6-dimethylallyladenosine synthase